MIAIVPTSKILAALPRGLFMPKDTLLICKSDEKGRVIISNFTEYHREAADTEIAQKETEHSLFDNS